MPVELLPPVTVAGLKATEATATAAADELKLTPAVELPLIVIPWLVGENRNPLRLGVMVYVPLAKPPNA